MTGAYVLPSATGLSLTAYVPDLHLPADHTTTRWRDTALQVAAPDRTRSTTGPKPKVNQPTITTTKAIPKPGTRVGHGDPHPCRSRGSALGETQGTQGTIALCGR